LLRTRIVGTICHGELVERPAGAAIDTPDERPANADILPHCWPPPTARLIYDRSATPTHSHAPHRVLPVPRRPHRGRPAHWQAGPMRQRPRLRQSWPPPQDGPAWQSQPARQARPRPQGNTDAARQAMAGKEISPSTPATPGHTQLQLVPAGSHRQPLATAGKLWQVSARSGEDSYALTGPVPGRTRASTRSAHTTSLPRTEIAPSSSLIGTRCTVSPCRRNSLHVTPIWSTS